MPDCLSRSSDGGRRDEAAAGGLARHGHGGARHLGRPAAQRRGDHAPRRPPDPHHPHRHAHARRARRRRRAASTACGWTPIRRPSSTIRDIDIVVELIGGIEPARNYVLRAIANGKHVVTANKALLAAHGNEIFAAAQKAGVMVAFEAAVAGGIPIIKALREGLTANRIEWIAGIINGTSNFILSEMRATGATFAAALKDAQATRLRRGRSRPSTSTASTPRTS